MKTTILLALAFVLLSFNTNAYSQQNAPKATSTSTNAVRVACTPDLFELTSNWAGEYNSTHPDQEIQVVKSGSDNYQSGNSESLSFVSSKSESATGTGKSRRMVVGRDVIVPVMNSANPDKYLIEKQGISQEQFAQLINNPEMQNWTKLITNGANAPVHLYMMNDESVKVGVSRFLKVGKIPVQGITLCAKEEFLMAIQKDPYAIGFCKVSDIAIPGNQGFVENIRLLPIDKNGNGSIDYMEDIYSNLNVFMRGVWIGKYPKALYSNIYAVSTTVPSTMAQITFLNWVLTDGQQYMQANGFCELTSAESESLLDKINIAEINVAPESKTSQTGLLLLIVVLVIMAALVVNAIVRSYRKQGNVTPQFIDEPNCFSEDGVQLPHGLYFDRSHTWAFMERDGNVTIGIDDFLQHITGHITKVAMKNQGEKIRKGEKLFSIIQDGKQLSLYSPVSGTITRQNETLVTNSAVINSSPYSEGWVYQIVPTNWIKEIQEMDMAEKYKNWIDNEFSRVKDFLASVLKPESLEYVHVVMQDGGILKEGVLSDFGPEVWEDFQTNFLDDYK